MDNNYNFYKEIADSRISGWRAIDKNELFNLYIKNENNQYIREGYFAAILLKYWNLINSKRIMSCGYATYDDCYNWLVDSIYTALKERKWKDSSNKLFMDKKGPDKVVNKLMKTHLVTHFQVIKKDKRIANMNLESTDDMNEDFNFEVPDIDIDIENSDILPMIHTLCLKRDYLSAIVAHIVCFDSKELLGAENVVPECVAYIRESTESYLTHILADIYRSNVLKDDISKIKNMDNLSLKRGVQYSIYILSKAIGD